MRSFLVNGDESLISSLLVHTAFNLSIRRSIIRFTTRELLADDTFVKFKSFRPSLQMILSIVPKQIEPILLVRNDASQKIYQQNGLTISNPNV